MVQKAFSFLYFFDSHHSRIVVPLLLSVCILLPWQICVEMKVLMPHWVTITTCDKRVSRLLWWLKYIGVLVMVTDRVAYSFKDCIFLLLTLDFPICLFSYFIFHLCFRLINPVVVSPTIAAVGLSFYSYGFPRVGACIEIGAVQILLVVIFSLVSSPTFPTFSCKFSLFF